MNYNYLRYFSVLAQLEHYTLAAARLEISQPSLSSAIRSLEDELGVKLFEKAGRNIRLTEEGRYFQKKVDAAMEELSTATQMLLASRENAPIVFRLGFVSGSLNGAVARQMASCIRDNDRFRFHITEGSAKDLMDLLHQEKLDMAIVDVTSRDRSLHFRKLRQRNFYVAVPTDHPLAEKSSVSVSDLTDFPQIGFSHSMDKSFEDWASHPDVKQNFICQVNTVSGALSLVSAGLGVTTIPGECIVPMEGISFIPLENRHQALYSCIVYDRWLTPQIWDFVERVIKAVRA
ncbi:MAG: LysR family transcriptional regulator [Oscillospiraceae bacterium]|nr:LysR family transcriptional regulator [Oscillospiraceae bacterium]